MGVDDVEHTRESVGAVSFPKVLAWLVLDRNRCPELAARLTPCSPDCEQGREPRICAKRNPRGIDFSCGAALLSTPSDGISLGASVISPDGGGGVGTAGQGAVVASGPGAKEGGLSLALRRISMKLLERTGALRRIQRTVRQVHHDLSPLPRFCPRSSVVSPRRYLSSF